MMTTVRSALFILLLTVSCDGTVGDAKPHAPAPARQSPGRQLDLGGGIRVVVDSKNLAGSLAVVRGDGSLVTTHPTNEITWIQLFDFDEDGVFEIVTEEIDGRGTGVVEKTFRVYRVTSNGVREVWSGRSFRRHAPDPGHIEESSAFVRFDPSGGGRNARLTHLLLDPSGRATETVYEWRDGGFHALPD